MVSETLYCERLAYLEWAQAEFAHNAHTVEGALRHERVDVPRALPARPASDAEDDEAAADDGRPIAARSVWLSSETLGVTAKIDVVEGQGATVVPIEYKKGRSPEIHEGAYLPQRAQVAVQILLLREHGFDVPYGILWFAKDRRKVRVDLDSALERVTRWAIDRARRVTAAGVLPPPLVDDPRCRGCSLAGICLPDETTLLRGFTGQPMDDPAPPPDPILADLDGPLDPDPWGLAPPHAPRRIRRFVPSGDERIPLYVRAQGSSISVEGGQLVVRTSEGTRSVRMSDTSEVVLFGNIQITTQALRALLEREIPVSFFSYGGWFVGRAVGHSNKNAELHVAQVRAVTDPDRALDMARRMVAAKILNQRTMLRRNHAAPDAVLLDELKRLARSAFDAPSLDSLRGTEGTAARLYFGAFTGMLKQLHDRPFDLDGRNRRPPRDPINALLSLAYAMLAKDATHACQGVGLDPLLGAYHQPRYGRPSLALDLMEELRPLVADSVVITAVNTGVVTPDDFVHAAGSCALKDHARKRFIEAYERRMEHEVQHPVFGYRISYRRLLEVQARLLSRTMLGELSAYVPFRTR
jgi:CRISPR-associated protein Cas1